jgi:2-keto-4-pentenoate hydratase/2-oxohepta-3-ene-1,7-dioic acid hydratase in catechol pathway
MDKIVCVGKNYLEHAKELGDAVPESPVFFLKPPSALLVADGSAPAMVPIPKDRGQVHHECEIVARITLKNGTHQFDAVTLGLDMTLREVQSHLKKEGHPWEASKVFTASAVVGPWISIQEFSDYLTMPFTFKIDGQLRQKGVGTEMRVSPVDCLRYAAGYFPLCEGDLLFTGTPAGVGPVAAGQSAELEWGNRLRYQLKFT